MSKGSGIYLELIFPMMNMNFEHIIALCLDLVFPLITVETRPKISAKWTYLLKQSCRNNDEGGTAFVLKGGQIHCHGRYHLHSFAYGNQNT